MISEVQKSDIESLKIIARDAIAESVQVSSELKIEIIFDTEDHIETGLSGDNIFLKGGIEL